MENGQKTLDTQKKKIQMANVYMKKCTPSYDIREMNA